MYRLLLIVLLSAATASAQVPMPRSASTFGFPILVGAGSMELGTASASGVTSPVPGFTAVIVNNGESLSRYVVIDLSGGMAVIACFALPCTGLTEDGAEEAGDDWIFIDGVLLPRFDAGLLVPTPIGGVGGGFELGASGANADGESFGWVDLGLQLAHGAQFGSVDIITTATYAVGYEGGAQALTGRAVKVRADLRYPLGGIQAIGFVALDRRTDSRNTDSEADDLRSSFVTFGAGIGF